ncbi:hypothetical protein F3Y22_tig00012370pilonHSYRG00131 [Hibiscus syriacus]|uniref:Phytocyanin domain-containing protein n=1 Tax=Hibiscus syriacus TaxID=106335 RepID=A0A6A3C3R5_HIBSY|nr:hypothetical protein F3Y22_tig00012370pilonHSYRG00131 [Hibiscus syriacus]
MSGGGDGADEGESMSPTQELNDAITYVNAVKEAFQDQEEKYVMFLQVMTDYMVQRTDIIGVFARVRELFQGHDNLISGFIAFLPKGDQEGMEMIKDEWFCMVVALLAHRKGFHDKLLCFCTLSSGQNQVSGGSEAAAGRGGGAEGRCLPRKPTKDDAVAYLKEVKETFHDEEDKYNMVLQVLKNFMDRRINVVDVIAQTKELVKGHTNLIDGFNTFLPKKNEIKVDKVIDEAQATKIYHETLDLMMSIRERFQDEDEHVLESFVDTMKMCKGKRMGLIEVAPLLKDYPDLIQEFKSFVPDLKCQSKGFLELGFFCFMQMMIQKAHAREFQVNWGLHNGSNAENYNQWAEKNRFQIGDSLVFSYAPNDASVLHVTEEAYKNCNLECTDRQIHRWPHCFLIGSFRSLLFHQWQQRQLWKKREEKTTTTVRCHSDQPLSTAIGVNEFILDNSATDLSTENETVAPSPSPVGSTEPPSPTPLGESPPEVTVEINPTLAPSEETNQSKNAATSLVLMRVTGSTMGAMLVATTLVLGF